MDWILRDLIGGDFEEMSALEFEDLICEHFKKNFWIRRQVYVDNRGDGMRGKIDIVLKQKGRGRKKEIAIEIDRQTPRHKSFFKLKQYNASRSFIILRSPFHILAL